MERLFAVLVVGLILSAVVMFGLHVPMWNLMP